MICSKYFRYAKATEVAAGQFVIFDLGREKICGITVTILEKEKKLDFVLVLKNGKRPYLEYLADSQIAVIAPTVEIRIPQTPEKYFHPHERGPSAGDLIAFQDSSGIVARPLHGAEFFVNTETFIANRLSEKGYECWGVSEWQVVVIRPQEKDTIIFDLASGKVQQ